MNVNSVSFHSKHAGFCRKSRRNHLYRQASQTKTQDVAAPHFRSKASHPTVNQRNKQINILKKIQNLAKRQ
jgi:hypothetical protein